MEETRNTALITGASGGIGEALARECARASFSYSALIDRWLAGWAATLASAHD